MMPTAKMPKIEARMYLADRRQGSESADSRHFQTAFDGSPELGNLRKISDDTLRAGTRLLLQAEADSTVVLIPYVGDLQLTDATGTEWMKEEGQVHAWTVPKGKTCEIKNPYAEEAIHFFQITFAGFPDQPVQTKPVVMDERPDELLPVCLGAFKVFIGKYGGRREGSYKVEEKAGGIFAFVVEGAFEVQNRLLESRDGLALRNAEEVEFEALSSDAVLLLIEV